MGKGKNKGKRAGLPKEPPPDMDEKNAVYVGRRVAVRGIRSPIMVVTGQTGNVLKVTWFDEQLVQRESRFLPVLLVIVPEDHEKDPPKASPEEIAQFEKNSGIEPSEDPLETLKKAQAADPYLCDECGATKHEASDGVLFCPACLRATRDAADAAKD